MREDIIRDMDLIVTLGKIAYTRGLSILRNTHDAEDAAQETILDLWSRSNRTDAEPIEDYKRWVSTVATNKSRRILRRVLNEVPVAKVRCQGSSCDPIRVVLDIAEGLEPRAKQVWILRFLLGATIRQISLALQVSEGTVKRRLRAATGYARFYISEIIADR